MRLSGHSGPVGALRMDSESPCHTGVFQRSWIGDLQGIPTN